MLEDGKYRLESIESLEGKKYETKRKLQAAEKKIQKLEQILMKKTTTKGKLPPLPLAETTLTIGGFPVADFKMPARSSKVIVPEKVDVHFDPTLRNHILEGINHRHLQRTKCRREVDRQIQEKEIAKEMEIELKKKKVKKTPKVKGMYLLNFFQNYLMLT